MPIVNSIIKKLINYKSEKSFGYKLRKKRSEKIISLIEEFSKSNEPINIIDIGGTRTYWNIIPGEFLKEKKVHITVIDLPGYNQNEKDDELFTFKVGNGCDLSEYPDKKFHISHSNSVIEHVGDWEHMVRFSKESRRIAKAYYVQTPNYWFPIEPHYVFPFFQWLPEPIKLWLILNFRVGRYVKSKNTDDAMRAIDNIRLISKKMIKELFKDGKLHKEKFCLLTKSFIMIGN